MRFVVLVLVLAGCVRDAPGSVARCASCENLIEPQAAMSNARRFGPCRVEVRKGDGCCLVRWDVAPKDGDSGSTFDPTSVSLCVGEKFTVCGEEIECAP